MSIKSAAIKMKLLKNNYWQPLFKTLIYPHMKTLFTAEDIQYYESTLDSCAHELIQLLESRERQVKGEASSLLIDEYYSFRKKLQAKAQELYPYFNFENF